jgi:tRNA G18 (ribose-2'-O)-methylase SpoU
LSSQLSHKEHATSVRRFPIVLLADNLMGDANIGSLFRLADAFNIEKIIFTGTPVNLNSTRLKRTARATVNNVANEFYEDPMEPLKVYSEMGYEPIALEITEDSCPIHEMKFGTKEKILLVVGNERHGISSDLLQKITLKVHINMYGKNSSMNVSQAAGIAFYEISKTLPSLREK